MQRVRRASCALDSQEAPPAWMLANELGRDGRRYHRLSSTLATKSPVPFGTSKETVASDKLIRLYSQHRSRRRRWPRGHVTPR